MKLKTGSLEALRQVILISKYTELMELERDKVVTELISRLKNGDRAVKVEGTWGSFARLLAVHISKVLKRVRPEPGR